MLDVTPRAINALHDMLARALTEGPWPDGATLGFRLVATTGAGGDPRLGLALDSPRTGDVTVQHEGLAVLILDASASRMLNHLTLDLMETGDGTRLGLRE